MRVVNAVSGETREIDYSRVHAEAVVKVAASRCGEMLLTIGDDGRALLLSSPKAPTRLSTGSLLPYYSQA